MTLTDKFISNLKAYENKDIQGVAELFAEDIFLRDWKISVKGKPDVLRETKKNFNAGGNININVLRTFEDKNTVVAELHILVEGVENIYVTDIATFNSDGLIQTIRAYIGRED
jgi:ketosteroid isomerase-like protein